MSTLESIHVHVRTVVAVLCPSPFAKYLSLNIAIQATQRPTSYIDGIRGLAAFVVFIDHFAAPFKPGMLQGYGVASANSVFQLPIIRLFYGGDAMVALFFAISGFALSLRPLELIHDGAWESLMHLLASAIFRRGIRLFLPTIFASVIILVGVRLGLYEIYVPDFPAEYGYEQPRRVAVFATQLKDWIRYILSNILLPFTWLMPTNVTHPMIYASHLWTIPVEFWSSLLLYMAIVGLSKVHIRTRACMSLVLIAFALSAQRSDIGLFLAGMVCAEHHLSRRGEPCAGKTTEIILRELSGLFTFLSGLYFASYPFHKGDRTPGYRWLATRLSSAEYWYAFGAIQILWGVTNSMLLQRVFSSSPLQYLGHISFALYIVHMPILNTWGWAIVPWIQRLSSKETRAVHDFDLLLAFSMLVPLVLWVADIFWRYVDQPSIQLAKRLSPGS